jgi:ADP-ribosylglycohydrolase
MAQYKTITDWTDKTSGHITSSGWVVDTLEVALWAFFKYDSWKKGALAVVNRGGDSDTAGAVYGGLAGAYYGVEVIPQEWKDGMQRKDFIGGIANKLAQGVVDAHSK